MVDVVSTNNSKGAMFMAKMTVGKDPYSVLTRLDNLSKRLDDFSMVLSVEIGAVQEKEGVEGYNTLPRTILDKYEPLKANIDNLNAALAEQIKHARIAVAAAEEVSGVLTDIG